MDQPSLTSGPRLAPGCIIRLGVSDDLGSIAAIEETVFDTDQLSRRSLRRFLQVPTTVTVVAACGGDLAGYAMIGFRKGSGVGRLFSLAVLPERSRGGLGRGLLAASEEAAWSRGAMAVRLEVREDNAPAIGLYERAGYTRAGRVPDYYEDGAAALRFSKMRG